MIGDFLQMMMHTLCGRLSSRNVAVFWIVLLLIFKLNSGFKLWRHKNRCSRHRSYHVNTLVSMTKEQHELLSSKNIPSPILQTIFELGYTTLTPIQEKVVPLMLGRKDVIGYSYTGSGKTLAFTIPLLAVIDFRISAAQNAQAMIICPTRELAAQVASVVRKLGRHITEGGGLRIAILCGGTPGSLQKKALDKGVHVIVGTPGRINDHLQRGRLDLTAIKTVVLDEADKMLDMGFEEQTANILSAIPATHKVQTAFFSATKSSTVIKMSQRWQKNVHYIDLINSTKREAMKAGHSTIEDEIEEMLSGSSSGSNDGCESMADIEVTKKGTAESQQLPLSQATQQGANLENQSRLKVEQESELGVRRGAAATAGIPTTVHEAMMVRRSDKFEELLRTLAAFDAESSLVFCNYKASVQEIVQLLQEAGVSVCALHGDMEQRDRDRMLTLFRNKSRRVLVATDVASRGIDIHNVGLVVVFEVSNTYETHVHRIGRSGRAGAAGHSITLVSEDERSRFELIEAASPDRIVLIDSAALPLPLQNNPSSGGGGGGQGSASRSASGSGSENFMAAAMDTIRIDGGRVDKLRPGDILGALTNSCGLTREDVGLIQTHDKFTYVAVKSSVSKQVVKILNSSKSKPESRQSDPVPNANDRPRVKPNVSGKSRVSGASGSSDDADEPVKAATTPGKIKGRSFRASLVVT